MKIHFFKNTESLTKVVFFNIGLSYVYNALSLIIGFISIPYFLKLLTENQYGIWITIFSILSWITIFDFGLSQGLRNRLPEMINNKDKVGIKDLIESSYFITISISLFFVFCTVISVIFFDLNIIFNVYSNPIPENINLLFPLIIFLFAFQFSMNNIVGILHASLKSANVTLLDFFSKSISFIGLLIFFYFGLNSLYLLAIITILSRVLIMMFFTLKFSKSLFNNFNISLNFFDFNFFSKRLNVINAQKPYLKESFYFFVINISTIFLINSIYFLINFFFSSAEVVPYSISFKLFSSLLVLFYLFLAPFWSAITDSFLKTDFEWIKKAFLKMLFFYLLFVICVFIIYKFSDFIFDLWIGKETIIPHEINFAVFIYVLIMGWNSLFAHVLNGLKKLDYQFRIAIFHILTNIPICWFFAIYLDFGMISLIWVTNFNLLLLSIFLPVELLLITKKINTK